ncbi:MAG: amidohydrolase family protein [Lachnospiraceae bacterium]|nr:amidohydrolase family protein [Lachnospiraceae bacterium]
MDKTILLKHAALIMEDANCLMDRNLYVSDGRIARIVVADQDDGKLHADETIDCSRFYVSCGMVNMHAHMAMNIFKGIAEDVTSDAWFNEMIFPYESKMTDDDVYLGTKLAIAEMVNNGITAVADHYFGEEQVVKAVKETGIRGDISPTLFGSMPGFEERLESVKAFIEAHRGDSDRIAFRIGPHADYTCPPDTLEKMVQAARDLNLSMHLHLADAKDTNKTSMERYGKTTGQILKEAGVLDMHVLFGHGLWMDEDVAQNLTDKIWFAFCPKTYMKMALGHGSFWQHRKDVQFGFGTDGGASSNTLNVFEQARMYALAGKYTTDDPTDFTVEEVWKHLTAGHKAFSFGTGVLKEGAPADLVIWDLATPDTYPIYHPVTAILYSANSSNVRYTMVGGEFLKKDGRLTMDVDTLLSDVRRAQKDLLARGKGKANVSFLK